ncbi:hypothetical protein BJF88_06185 [Cellulosimicrobium sp. CUA-896]|nr:hypothetical protein BJF88_06185 [Cellulosimicrobium sp. CUA-896]
MTPDQPSVADPDGTTPSGPRTADGGPGRTVPELAGAGAPGTRTDPRFAVHRAPVPFARAPFAGVTWREFGFLWLALVLAPFGFTYTVFTVSFTGGILATVVGLVVSSALVLGGRGWGAMYRSMARTMLSVDVTAPAPYVRPRGFWRTLWSGLADGTGWRALAFLLVTFPLAIAAAVVSTVLLAVGLGGMTHWVWSRWLPAQQAGDGTWHRGASSASTGTSTPRCDSSASCSSARCSCGCGRT